MSRTVVVEPVTRVEGHAKITIHLDDRGEVADARFHVTEFRGFEKFCEGRHFTEMPVITSRICGICPVSHMLASAAAGDDILAVTVPETAVRLRRIVNLGQVLQSHALSFFYLSAPDLLLGYDADPASLSIVGLAGRDPELARAGIRLRQFGQRVIEIVAGRRIHPSWAVAGGVVEPLTAAGRETLLAEIPAALALVQHSLVNFKRELEAHAVEARTFGNFPSLFLGMVDAGGGLEHYGGLLRIVDAEGRTVADRLTAGDALALIGEAVEPWSYMKFPYYRPLGYPDGMYRVGPLARLNAASHCGTPRADAELAEFRQLGRGAVLSSFHYHYARLIEMVYAIERIGQLLDDPAVLSRHVQAHASRNRDEGIGMSEAPRGTLFHRYRVDDNGLLTTVDLLIATGQNNLAMNRAILQVARQFVTGPTLTRGMENRVEAAIRAFDPCLSCSTHAAGAMPLVLELVDASGTTVDRLVRTS